MNEWRVSGQVIVITGGSRGIGLATAKVLVARGAKVALMARDESALTAAVQELGAEQAIGLATDVCRRDEIERALAVVNTRWGRIDGLINNVGFQFARRIELTSEHELRQLLDLNFISAVFGCQCAIPFLRKAGGGRIINISSASVRHNNEFAHLGVYSAAKAALDHLTAELRDEVKGDNIMVTLFSPGAVATGSIANFEASAVAEAMAAWLAKGPLFDGALQPEIIGEAIAHCFEYPPGVAAEFVEVRPNRPTPKQLESEWQ
jgi:NAD(P)-dependent dehydrogenase (short-subunit alcohol dehydrogenase family)